MKRPKVTGLRRRESWQALPFLLPSLLGLCLFYLFPLAETVRASFMDPLRSRAVGWGNYRALFQNTAFRLAVRNTCRFLCICIPALLAVSLLCAVLLGAAKRRAVFFKISCISSGDSSGFASNHVAMTPATKGEACDVPVICPQ